MRIVVFCGSKSGTRTEYAQAARELGTTLAKHGIGVVYGGTANGLMQVLADSALDTGGEVIGVMASGLGEMPDARVAHMETVETLAQRKARMAELGDAFITLPGGLGTLDEWSEIVTWSMIGLHQKPIAILNIAGFYDDFLRYLERAVQDGFWKPHFHEALIVESEVEALLQVLAARLEANDGRKS